MSAGRPNPIELTVTSIREAQGGIYLAMPTEQLCLTVLDTWLGVQVVLGPEQLVVMGPIEVPASEM